MGVIGNFRMDFLILQTTGSLKKKLFSVLRIKILQLAKL